MDPIRAWTFPHGVCETPVAKGLVKYPWSFSVSVLNTLFLAEVSSQAVLTKPALLSFATFSFYHALCHAIVLEGYLQTLYKHVLLYIVAAACHHSLWNLTRSPPYFTWPIWTAVFTDVAVFFTVGGVGSVLSGMLVLSSVVFAYWPLYPIWVRTCFLRISGGGVVLGLLFMVEALHCRTVTRMLPLPYHVLIEMFSGVLFSSVGCVFLRWEDEVHQQGLTPVK